MSDGECEAIFAIHTMTHSVSAYRIQSFSNSASKPLGLSALRPLGPNQGSCSDSPGSPLSAML
jgi:hypothetical protein